MTVAIRPGDVLWCYFPTRERPGQPSIDLHPALVLGFEPSKSPRFAPKLIVAFGTSQAHGPLTSWQLSVVLQGQQKPTIFHMTRRITLPVTDDYFPDLKRMAHVPDQLEGEIRAALLAALAHERATKKP